MNAPNTLHCLHPTPHTPTTTHSTHKPHPTTPPTPPPLTPPAVSYYRCHPVSCVRHVSRSLSWGRNVNSLGRLRLLIIYIYIQIQIQIYSVQMRRKYDVNVTQIEGVVEGEQRRDRGLGRGGRTPGAEQGIEKGRKKRGRRGNQERKKKGGRRENWEREAELEGESEGRKRYLERVGGSGLEISDGGSMERWRKKRIG